MAETTFLIERKHYNYLFTQKGGISHIANREDWLAAYHDLMSKEYASVVPYLPASCARVLDVGGGLGGIDVLINRHYGGDVHVEILDGIDTAPTVIRSSIPHNSMDIARDFLTLNGVRSFSPVSPLEALADKWEGRISNASPCDLIVSFGAWSFHFTPDLYLKYVLGRCRAGATLIIDVRTRHDDWRQILDAAFKYVATIPTPGEKFERRVYVAR